jgi:hypothetical protein
MFAAILENAVLVVDPKEDESQQRVQSVSHPTAVPVDASAGAER